MLIKNSYLCCICKVLTLFEQGINVYNRLTCYFFSLLTTHTNTKTKMTTVYNIPRGFHNKILHQIFSRVFDLTHEREERESESIKRMRVKPFCRSLPFSPHGIL